MASQESSLLAYAELGDDRRKEKAPGALRTISEASDLLEVPQHVLRFWETKFSQIKPLKRNGGRRFYRPQDLDILQQVKFLLYSQGYTIKGAKKAIEEFARSGIAGSSDWLESVPSAGVNDNTAPSDAEVLAELAEALGAEPDAMPAPVASGRNDELRRLRESLLAARTELARLLQVA